MPSNLLTKCKKIVKPLEKTILHPQWLSYRCEVLEDWIAEIHQGTIVLDIGCADRWPEKFLPKECRYIGLDYAVTAIDMYNSHVDVYATAENLPFDTSSIDTILMFDVFEHIRDGDAALSETYRVLKPGGKALVQIPFMYPIHDAPFDYRRPTEFGVVALAERHNFVIEKFGIRGKPLETACLLLNIAMVKSLLNAVGRRRILAVLLLPFVIVMTVLSNIVGWVASSMFANDNLMPFSYHFILKKTGSS